MRVRVSLGDHRERADQRVEVLDPEVLGDRAEDELAVQSQLRAHLRSIRGIGVEPGQIDAMLDHLHVVRAAAVDVDEGVAHLA